METEINQNNIIAHVAGLTENTKTDFFNLLKKSQFSKHIEIVDVDVITTKIIEDDIMEKLFAKFEYYSERSKSQYLTLAENRAASAKVKQLEKKMFQYWKVRMEYYINKLACTNKKKLS